MQCSKCGTMNQEGVAVCTNCGTPLVDASTPVAPTVAPATPSPTQAAVQAPEPPVAPAPAVSTPPSPQSPAEFSNPVVVPPVVAPKQSHGTMIALVIVLLLALGGGAFYFLYYLPQAETAAQAPVTPAVTKSIKTQSSATPTGTSQKSTTTPVAADTSSWKTYTTTDSPVYSIQYPSDWTAVRKYSDTTQFNKSKDVGLSVVQGRDLLSVYRDAVKMYPNYHVVQDKSLSINSIQSSWYEYTIDASGSTAPDLGVEHFVDIQQINKGIKWDYILTIGNSETLSSSNLESYKSILQSFVGSFHLI